VNDVIFTVVYNYNILTQHIIIEQFRLRIRLMTIYVENNIRFLEFFEQKAVCSGKCFELLCEFSMHVVCQNSNVDLCQ
jgi:hypothetical protein